MATNRVMSLDTNSLYIYCPTCEANGTKNVPVNRDMDTAKCAFGHTFTGSLMMTVRPFSGDLPDTANMSMVPLSSNEQPPPTSIKWNIWVNPKVKELLESKFKGNLIATTDVLLSSLADGNVLIMSGPDVAKLKKRGISNGAQCVAALEASDNADAENRQLRAQIEKYESVFRQAGIGQ
jgi:hypothetical protein